MTLRVVTRIWRAGDLLLRLRATSSCHRCRSKAGWRDRQVLSGCKLTLRACRRRVNGQSRTSICSIASNFCFAARDAGIEQVPLQHGVMLGEHRDDHGGIFRALAFVDGRSVGGHQHVELAKSVCDGPAIKARNELNRVGVCALKRCTVLPGENPGRQTLAPAGSTRGGSGGDEWPEATSRKGPAGGKRSVRAATRVNIEQASKQSMWEPTRHSNGEGRRRR